MEEAVTEVMRLQGELAREKIALETALGEKQYWKRTAEELGRQLDDLRAKHAPRKEKK